MTTFLQLHLLTPYAAANLNRDDTGRPKTLNFGGAERLRISSQSLKRAFRESDAFAGGLPGALGTRSKRFAAELIEALVSKGLDRADAVSRAEAVVEHDHLGKVKDKGKGAAKTEQLVHLGPDELQAIADLAERLANSPDLSEKAALILKDKPRAADIAMFGRMLADNSGYNVEAAVQVAHAFTTHRVVVEDDYFTAMDDIEGTGDEAHAGGAHIGVQQYGAGLFYLYICIDTDLLLNNLSGEGPLAADALEALIRAAATVSPTGKQNSFASRAKAIYVLQEVGQDAPRSLAGAFQQPVGTGDHASNYETSSIARLKTLRDGYAKAYGEQFEAMELNVSEGGVGLSDLIAAARRLYEKA
jgi:CRISPR system Cascade subunit CasC